MSTKPILFSTPMVQAILDGRKTMTRRVIKPQPMIMANGKPLNGYNDSMIKAAGEFLTPKYQPGDILWVRETWCNISDWTCVDPSVGLPDGFIYKADWHARLEHPRWRPSIHMPRAAARLFLRVTDVRVERVQDMPLFDVWDEGTPQMPGNLHSDGAVNQWDFRYLWDALNAKRGFGWDVNPWVWAITFEQTAEVDVCSPK